jgi:hypothetical protein
MKRKSHQGFKPVSIAPLRVGVLTEMPDSAFCDLMSELGHSATLLRQIENDNADAERRIAERDYKPLGVFVAGDRVVMRGTALVAAGCMSGPDCARVWTVIECGCDLCQQSAGRLVAVDQEVDGYGWRHISKVALRHYGQPTVDELTAAQCDAQRDDLQKGLRIAFLGRNR